MRHATVHTATVRDRRIHWNNREIVQHGINSDAIKLDLDPEFSGLDRIEVWLTTDAIAPEAFEDALNAYLDHLRILGPRDRDSILVVSADCGEAA